MHGGGGRDDLDEREYALGGGERELAGGASEGVGDGVHGRLGVGEGAGDAERGAVGAGGRAPVVIEGLEARLHGLGGREFDAIEDDEHVGL